MNLSKNAKDLTGRRFGRLTAVEPIDSVPGRGFFGDASVIVEVQKMFRLLCSLERRHKAVAV